MLTSDDLAFFAVVATSASLAASARKLNVTPPAVTQRLRGLEARLGVRLVERSHRHLGLTDEGALVAAQAHVVATALDTLSDALGDRRNQVSGHLRVTAPHGFGRVHVAPVVAAFVRLHPAVTVTLDLSDHPGAQLVDSSDAIIHIGAAGSMSQIVTTLAPNRRLLVASPTYLARATPVAAPADLTHHRCLVVRENEEDVTLWRLKHGVLGTATMRIDPFMSSNDGTVVRGWALAGAGLAIRSEWDVADDLVAGRLIHVLTDWEAPPADVVAILGARHGRSARTTAFLSVLRQSLAPVPWRLSVT
ncbi:LysR substrate-binding domain-containing protein [Sphingomonas solaris]|uniref:LysR family transcriptional regulator n=2 Tax=Alterirhizorhabdus solaris TaxID=2529389 RepID=A0A558QR71_9SPHN|nr:LysR substrate-binding domain-containing protein [Sphingomonas solaris]TVV69646.1 LysR family transcriptional regulator [Sphingomonas solaris]